MQYTSLSINDSPTIAMEAAAELKDARCLAVKFDENGKRRPLRCRRERDWHFAG